MDVDTLFQAQLDDLDRKPSAIPASRPKIVAFESVYSLDGDIAPITKIIDVAERHGAKRI